MPKNIMPESGIHWTDIARASSGSYPDRNSLVVMLINEVVAMCNKYQNEAMSLTTELEGQLDGLTGKDVTLNLDDGEQITGTVLGINRRGELRVLVDGHERAFNSADVSLRKAGHADH
jgi:biotin-(acetyl-CoA carboxylase) ligase